MMLLTRGELAKQGGVNRETIRYYERNGLLRETTRTESGYYLFTEAALRRIQFIKRAQAVGFSLNEIKALLDLEIDDAATSGDVAALTSTKIAEIDRKIESLQAMRRTLTRLLDDCPGGDHPTNECPILDHFADAEGVAAV